MERNGIQQALFSFIFSPPPSLPPSPPPTLSFFKSFSRKTFHCVVVTVFRNADGKHSGLEPPRSDQMLPPIKIVVKVERAKGLLRVDVMAVIVLHST